MQSYKFHLLSWSLKTLMCLLLSTSALTETADGAEPGNRDYFPGAEWRVSGPDAQGLSSSRVYSFLRALNASDRLHSVVIIKNGYLVTEAYYHPYHRGAREYMVSLGDCVLSALMGIAAERIPSVSADARVMTFFDEEEFTEMTPRKKDMTIRDLLTMRASFDRQWKSDACNVSAMMTSPDPVSFILGTPMKENTSEFFSYSSLNSHLLSAIITKATGMSSGEFAEVNCFRPLGITTADWSCDATGVSWGGFGLRMSALDMARFGYLYLRGGEWNGKEIIPREWVESSVKSRIPCDSFPYDTEGFGYQWWIEPWGYSARGMSGHYLLVIPSRDIVVVITSEYQFYTLHQSFGNRYAMFDGELRDGPAKHYVSELAGMYLADSSSAEERDASAEKRLSEYLSAIGKSPYVKYRGTPRTAADVSGKKIIFGANPYRIKSIMFTFRRTEGRIMMEYESGCSWVASIGGKGAFINTDAGDFNEIALRGYWADNTRYVMEEQEISESERFMYRFEFSGKHVTMRIIGSVSNQPIEVRGELID